MHVGICGVSGTGKTSLAKELSREYKTQGWGVLVYDPTADDWGNVDLVTSDKKLFAEAYFSSKNCRVFIDECTELDRNKDKAFLYMATRGRHYGHLNYFIAQRWKMIPRNMRSQCSRVFTFKQSDEDAKELAQDIGNIELKNANGLGRGEYIFATSFEAEYHNLF